MSLGVRREVVLSRSEIAETRLRAESPQPPACQSETGGVKRRLSWSVGCVMKRPFERFYSARFLVEDDVGPAFHVAGRRREVTAGSCLSDVSTSVVAA